MDRIKTGKSLILHPWAEKMAYPPQPRDVMLLNDDYTPFEYVYGVLMRDFQKGSKEALDLTCQIHCEGWVIAGTYPAEVAEEKCNKVIRDAQAAHHPFRADLWPS